MSWADDLGTDMKKRAPRAAGLADGAARRAASGTYPSGMTVRSSPVSDGYGGYGVMQCRMDGRRVCTGPGYVVVGDAYWLTSSRYVTVDHAGVARVDGKTLPGRRPLPGYREDGVTVRLAGGRLWINDHLIPDYVAPAGTAGCTVEQAVNG